MSERELPSPGELVDPAALAGDEPEELQRMTLLEHLEELRSRILRSLAALLVGFGVCFAFAKPIYNVLAQPVVPYIEGGKLSFLRVTDPFIVYVKVALLAGVFLMSPFILYQVWKFVSPGLYSREKRYAMPFVFFGSSFFLAGGLFGYFVAVPFAVRFLILEMGENFEPVITVDFWLNFLINVLLGLGLMFELPIMIFMLAMLGVVTPRFLLKHFRWAVLIIFVVAAVITPTPDVVNLCVVAIPTILLYLLGVAGAALAIRLRRKRAAAAEA
ncbi:MAG TPA: twin-arginine translocase subunit TatC [Thermoanaerobaculia bacterium]|nr:twin-arginine translocase subunit TatC [Thermoanaerobaculia bacterium]